MKAKTIAYWATTALVALAFGVGGVVDLTGSPDVVAGMAHLGYPLHLATVLGVWKVLGTAAILAPGLPRLKEWAYAGMVFDLTGASVAHAAAGDPIGNIVTPLVITAIVAASWALRPESRTLPSPARSGAPPQALRENEAQAT